MLLRATNKNQKRMTSVFGGVAVKEIDGYCVMIAQKRRKKAGENKEGRVSNLKVI